MKRALRLSVTAILAMALLLTALGRADTTLNFALVPAGSATLSGRVLDEQGNGVPSQYLELFPAGGGSGAYITTDSAGHYSFQVGPGSYTIQFAPNGPASNAPRDYYLYSSSFSVTQDTTLVLPLPAKKVTVHVQDATGDPVANVVVSTNQPNNNLTLGSLSARGGV